MLATGIVRRIDDLGRIVLPKELRRSLGFEEGTPLEIYKTEDGVLLKRYDPLYALTVSIIGADNKPIFYEENSQSLMENRLVTTYRFKPEEVRVIFDDLEENEGTYVSYLYGLAFEIVQIY